MRKLMMGLAAVTVGALAAVGSAAGTDTFERLRVAAFERCRSAGCAWEDLRADPFSLERKGRPARSDSGADDGALSQLRPSSPYRPSEDYRPGGGRDDDELERQQRARRLCARAADTSPAAGGAIDRPKGGEPRRAQPSDDNGQQGRRRLANDERQWLNHEFGCRRG